MKYKPDLGLIDLIKKMVTYQPNKRIKAYDAMLHPYFDELRDEKFGRGTVLPDFFNLSSGTL